MIRAYAALLVIICFTPLSGCEGDDTAAAPEASDQTSQATAALPASPALAEPSAWGEVVMPTEGRPPRDFSETQILRWNGTEIEYNPRFLMYTLNTPLFSDFAEKERAIWIPDGTSIEYRPEGHFEFPVGSVIVKSFLFSSDLREDDGEQRLIETRVLVRGPDEWRAWPYLWEEDGSSARLKVSGAVKNIEFTDHQGNHRTAHYMVPQRNQCLDCHEAKQSDGTRFTHIIGPTARNLNLMMNGPDGPINQLSLWAARGLLSGLPNLDQVDVASQVRDMTEAELDQMSAEEVEQAARDYLDINCAHCHNPAGAEGQTSNLFLTHDQLADYELGICKTPSSAGKGGFGMKYNIVPGKPDESILVYRLKTEEVGAMMPDIGRSLAHETGVALIRRWIAQMDPIDCDE